MQAIFQVFSKPPKILLARGLRLNRKEVFSESLQILPVRGITPN